MSRKYQAIRNNKLAPSVWPPPVYQAHFTDGSTFRMSFYSKAGKPLDVERGRSMCIWVAGPGRTFSHGFIDHNGQLRPESDFTQAAKRAKPIRTADIRELVTKIQARAELDSSHALIPRGLYDALQQLVA